MSDTLILKPGEFSTWEKGFKDIMGEDAPFENELYEGIGPKTNNHFPPNPPIPDAHADFENASDDKKLDLEDQNFIEDNHSGPRPPIGKIITEEQKQILQKYYDWHLNLLPQNGQEIHDNLKKRPDITPEQYQNLLDNQHTDYDAIKNEINNWLASFPNIDFKDKGITPANVRTKYDESSGTTSTPGQQDISKYIACLQNIGNLTTIHVTESII